MVFTYATLTSLFNVLTVLLVAFVLWRTRETRLSYQHVIQTLESRVAELAQQNSDLRIDRDRWWASRGKLTTLESIIAEIVVEVCYATSYEPSEIEIDMFFEADLGIPRHIMPEVFGILFDKHQITMVHTVFEDYLTIEGLAGYMVEHRGSRPETPPETRTRMEVLLDD